MIKSNVKHINPYSVKNFGCNSERIERATTLLEGWAQSSFLDATQKELKGIQGLLGRHVLRRAARDATQKELKGHGNLVLIEALRLWMQLRKN